MSHRLYPGRVYDYSGVWTRTPYIQDNGVIVSRQIRNSRPEEDWREWCSIPMSDEEFELRFQASIRLAAISAA